MAELDFDELDKAVSSLMTNVDTSKQPADLDNPVEKVVTIPSSVPSPVPSSVPEEPAVQPTNPAAPQASSESPQVNAVTPPSAHVTPSLAVKRRGQFMDIVHPSLNMTSSSKFSNRHGPTIRPSSSVEPLAPESSSEVPESVATEQNEAVPTESASQSSWPDPTDVSSESTAAVEQPASSDTALVDNPDTVAVDNAPTDSAEPAPLSSPFLAGAVVEKRPLGGLTSDSDVPPEADPEKSEPDAEAPTPAAPAVPPKVLPAEFGGDVMAVEAKDLSSHPDAVKAQVAPATSAEPATAVASEPTNSTVGGSISQQYTEQPSSGDQTNGSIYDTATYHQAIDSERPAKRSSSLRWIIWIVILLLLGAAGGAAYFYFTR